MTDCPRLRAQIEAFCPYNEQETADRLQMLQDIDTFPVLLTRANATAHFTASCWIVNPDRTKVLMAYHNLYQSWAWLGGHADGEEDLLAVALREANEESGIRAVPVSRDIFSLEILHVAPHVKRGKFVCAHLHLNATYLLEADDQGGGAGRRLRARDAAGLPQADGKGRAIKEKTPVPDGTGVFAAYFAYSTALVSRMTLTLIWPGYSSSDSIFLARSWASRIMLSSVTSSGLTMTRTSRPAWMA